MHHLLKQGGGNGTPASSPPSSTLLPLGTKYPGIEVEKFVKGEKGASGVVALVGGLFDTAKQLLAPVLVILFATFGVRLIIAGGNEEEFNKAANHFLYLLIGTAFVIFSKELSEIFSLYKADYGSTEAPGTFLSDEGIAKSTAGIRGYFDIIITFIRYVFGGIALFFVVKSGSVIIFNADEETVTQQKDAFIYGFAGFILIIASEALVKTVFGLPDPVPAASQAFSPGVEVSGGLSLLGNVTNLLLGIMSGLFLFTLVVGGVLYALSAGNEERGQKATKLIIGSLLGLVIAFSSYTIVAEFSRGRIVTEEFIEAPVLLEESTWIDEFD